MFLQSSTLVDPLCLHLHLAFCSCGCPKQLIKIGLTIKLHSRNLRKNSTRGLVFYVMNLQHHLFVQYVVICIIYFPCSFCLLGQTPVISMSPKCKQQIMGTFKNHTVFVLYLVSIHVWVSGIHIRDCFNLSLVSRVHFHALCTRGQ